MRFRTLDGYIVERTVRRTYPRVLLTDGDLTFQADLGWRRLSVAPRAGAWIETHLDAKM